MTTGRAMTHEEQPDEQDGRQFGKELRQYRTAAGLTLRSLADQITFDFSYLAQVERGVRGGSERLASKCDTALGTHGQLVRAFIEHRAQGARQSRTHEAQNRPCQRDCTGDGAVPP